MDEKDNHGLRVSYARSNLSRRGDSRDDRDRRRDDRDKPIKMDTMPTQ